MEHMSEFLFRARFFLKNRLHVSFRDLRLHYATDTPVAKRWFYPRYVGGNVHEPPVCALLYSYLKADSTFFDIGANVGFFTVLAGRICNGTRGSVHAFEIDPALISLIEKSVSMNSDMGKIFINCAAVTDKSGKDITFSPHQTGNPSTNQIIVNNGISSRKPNKKLQIQTASITVDDYVKTNSLSPDLIKVDIEGAEALAVHGMLKTLLEKKPRIILEVHPLQMSAFASRTDHTINMILEVGYEAQIIQDYRAAPDSIDRPKLTPLKIDELSKERPTMLFIQPK